MSAPIQAYPPWLTQVTTTLEGVETVSVLTLPLTYYGPSIPLGPEWTYGGLTSPDSTVTSTTTIPSTIFTASSASTSSLSTSSSASSDTTSATPSTFSIPSPSSTSSFSRPTSSSPPASTSGIDRATLVGVIFASILASVILFGLAVSCFLHERTRRKQASATDHSDSSPKEIDEEWLVIAEGDGSPRQSGEEADPFLRRDQASAPSLATDDAPARVNSDTVGSNNTNSSSAGSSSTGSGYGTVLSHPTLKLAPVSEEGNTYQHQQKYILSPEEQLAIERETILPPPPPPSRSHVYKTTHRSYTPPPQPSPTLDDFGSLPLPPRMTALGRSRQTRNGDGHADKDEGIGKVRSWLPSILGSALGGAFSGASLSRRSSVQQRQEDVEAANGLSDPPASPASPEMAETGASLRIVPLRELGGLEGNRPDSRVSGQTEGSGGTVFHDAPSSFGSSGPRAPTPVYRGTSTPPPAPPLPSSSTPPPRPLQTRDPLDDPAPRPLTTTFHFATSSNTETVCSDTLSTVSTTLMKLSHPPPALEDEPPAAIVEWGSRNYDERRSTFGMAPHPSDWTSETGSSRRAFNNSGSASSRQTAASSVSSHYSHSQRRVASPALSAVGPRIESPTLTIPTLPTSSIENAPLASIGEERVVVGTRTEKEDSGRPKSPLDLAQKRSKDGSLSPLPWAKGLGENWTPM